MNQRNLTFFFTVFTSFLLIQIAFQYFDDNNTRELVQQQEARRITQEKELVASIRSKTATTSQLGVVDYLKPDGNKGMGIRIDDALIIPREQTLPDNVRIFGNENQQLVQKAKTPQFVLYAPQSSTPTQLPDLPPNGRYDLQLLTLLPDSTPTVTLGKWQDGHFSLVASELTEDKRAEFLPAGEAIAFLKVNGKYYPVGTYAPLTEQFTPLRQLQGLITVFQWPERESVRNTDEEQFYLLENEYVQVVFSTKGGAIKEINLPFLSKSDHESVVREIGYDRQIENESPENAYFPSSSYLSYDSTTSKPVAHTKGKLGGYYPLLRRDFYTKNKRTQKVPAKFYAFNLISQFPELAETNYSVTHFDGQTITFVSQQTHRQITKTYRLASSGAPYVIEADLLVDGEDNDLWVTSGIPDVEIISGSTAPTLKYRMTRQGKPEVVTESLPQSGITNTTTTPDWLCNSNGFFGVILDPLSTIPAGYKIQTVSAQQAPSRLLALSDADSTLKPSEYTGYQMLLPVQSTGAPLKFRLYAGPFATDILNQVDAYYTDDSTGYNPDYIGCQSVHGWFTFISEPFAKFLLFLMKIFYAFTGSWGISIILLTVALRIMLYPLNAWSIKAMAKNQEIAPQIAAIREKYKKDSKRMNMEIMEIYREKGVSPLGGCLPLLIQMPFLIGMFDLLKSTFALRGASFIPGWINDLAAPDVLFSWSHHIFYIGNQFHLLPVLSGIVMFLQQRMTTAGSMDPNRMTAEQRQARAMGTVMTATLVVLFYHFPSGLNIYLISSMLLGIFQQWLTTRKINQSVTVIA